jgi:large subunit ribosomal protein L7Ae
MAPKRGQKKNLPRAPLSESKRKAAKKNPLFEKTPKNFRLGGDLQPKRDLSRFIKWPKYVRLQRMKRIMLMRLKVPPALNQFNMAIDRNQASQVLKLCKKYSPETKEAKKNRLMEAAQQKKAGQDSKAKKPALLKFGLKHVTTLIEEKKAQLVIIAHDVEPIELVCWLPALCRKKDVPYCIIKGKARLGELVHKKFASCVAMQSVRQEDKSDLDKLVATFKTQFNENPEMRKKGEGVMGIKSQHVMQRREKALRLENEKKMGLSIA